MNPKEFFTNKLNEVHKMASENLQLAGYIDNLTNLLSYKTFSAEESEQFSSAIQTLKTVLAERQKKLAKECLGVEAEQFY